MSSKATICNMALSHLGVSTTIANLDSDRTPEALACRAFYDTALDQALRELKPRFATRIKALNLLEEDPNSEWAYSYKYPNGCLAVVRILSGQRTDTRDTRIPYQIADEDSGTVILTDQAEAEAEWINRVTNTDRYPADFAMALSLLIAHLIAPRVAGTSKNGERAFQLYQLVKSQARAQDANEGQADQEPESEFIRGRE